MVVVLTIAGGVVRGGLVKKQEAVRVAWMAVEAQYRCRIDLIPNMVNTAVMYAAGERKTLRAVMAARDSALALTFSATDLTPERLAAFRAAQKRVGETLAHLTALTGRYADLRADQSFREMRAQVDSVQRRIAETQQELDTTLAAYNTAIHRFPAQWLAGMFGFKPALRFEAVEHVENF